MIIEVEIITNPLKQYILFYASDYSKLKLEPFKPLYRGIGTHVFAYSEELMSLIDKECQALGAHLRKSNTNKINLEDDYWRRANHFEQYQGY